MIIKLLFSLLRDPFMDMIHQIEEREQKHVEGLQFAAIAPGVQETFDKR